ncbi:MAG TPA: STAS domain-containing protein [Candidatus Acidoferrales bacterium]|nr:STAS domain-containing protein [Candidatus Acidoferrales bacterium]
MALDIRVAKAALPSEKVLVLDGLLTAETAFQLRDVAREDRPSTLVIDMSQVRYVDSSGLGVLIGLYVSFEQSCRRLLLAGISDRLWELFRICKIEDVFTRYPTVADAERTLTPEGVTPV